MKEISNFISRFMALIILAVAALALFVPASCLWIQTSWINYLLMIVMFGMGLTMKLSDFAVVFSRPKDILIGCTAQFLIMPLLAFGLGKLFGLEQELLVGVVLVGTCPGGTSSNVITYLSKGDTALSIGMTSVNTLLAPFLTPALTYLFLRTSVHVDVLSMFLSIIQVVILPIGLGILVNKLLGKYTDKVRDFLPTVSILAICMIEAAVVSHNSAKILTTGVIIFAVVILHNCLGYGFGFLTGWLFRMDPARKKASPSRSACRIPVLPRVLQEPLSRIFRWQPYPVRSSLSGTTCPAHCWQHCSGGWTSRISRKPARKHPDKQKCLRA